MATIFIGMDDTDNESSPGTGRLARRLCAECIKRGMQTLGVTRHQFLVDPRIPYTSHNSGACIAIASDVGLDALDFAFDFVAHHSADGSDPGVCIELAESVPAEIIAFGTLATRKVVAANDAYQLARSAGMALRRLGGTGLGVIGALACVGLRAGENNGRYIDLPGLRDLPDRVNYKSFAELGIELEYRGSSRSPKPGDTYETLGWIRPRLIEGKPVLIVKWSEEHNAWIPVDRKKSKRLA